jgi:GH25 family lysozyme M1 (1,4-beta-N-acetylmuramidase)
MPRSDGIDVSQWNGVIDWPAVKASGVTWVATQVLDRNKGNALDPKFRENRVGMANAGFAWRGLYYFLYAGRPVATQAAEYLAAVGAMQLGEFVMLDAEPDARFGDGQCTEAMSYEWVTTVERTTGRPSAVYTGAYVDGGRIWKSARIYDGERPRIFAAYTDEANARKIAAPYQWDVWQFSGTGRCPGVNGDVDLDQLDQTARFDAACGYMKDEDDDMIYQLIQPQVDGNPNTAWFVVYKSGRVRWANNADTAWCGANGVPGTPVAMGADQYNRLMNDATIGWPTPPSPVGAKS